MLSTLTACGGDLTATDSAPPASTRVGSADAVQVSPDGRTLTARLQYLESERTQRRIVHRAEAADVASLPADKIINYAWKLTLPPDFPDSSMSVVLFSWYDRSQRPVLQISTARKRFWTELLPSSAHEPVYKPFPIGLPEKGRSAQFAVSAVWSADPDRGRVLIRCNGVEVFRYRGITLPRSGAEVPYAALGLSYEGSGRPLAGVRGVHAAVFTDYRRSIGGDAPRLQPLPPLTPQRRVLHDEALDKIAVPAAETVEIVPLSDKKS